MGHGQQGTHRLRIRFACMLSALFGFSAAATALGSLALGIYWITAL